MDHETETWSMYLPVISTERRNEKKRGSYHIIAWRLYRDYDQDSFLHSPTLNPKPYTIYQDPFLHSLLTIGKLKGVGLQV